jgi:hypothetical protein
MTRKPTTPAPPPADKGGMPDELRALVHGHLRFGWWALLAFLSLGIALEALHGFKVGWYLNVSSQMRRLLFTLAHSHGTLLGLVNIAFAVTLPHLPVWRASRRRTAGAMLKAATLLLPGGFFLGGLIIHDGDAGLGILLVPVGAVLLLLAVLLCALAFRSARGSSES